MKTITITGFTILSLLLVSCGGGETEEVSTDTSNSEKVHTPTKEPASEESKDVLASQRVTLDAKGVGKIKSLPLEEVNPKMAEEGQELFKTNCTACHKTDKRFIGPALKDVLKRRSPEWIMNMILNPTLMTEEDEYAKELLVEFNGAAMANQNLTVEQARAILEYFRTL